MLDMTTPSRRQNTPHGWQYCSPRYLALHSGHWYTVVALGERLSRSGAGAVPLRARKERWRQALEQ